MRQLIAATLVTFVLAFATFVAAQSSTGEQRPGMDQLKGENTQMVSVEGCLVNEKDVPGRTPNVAERAAKPTGMFQDYILTNAKFIKGEPEGYVGTSGSEATTGGMSLGQMFEVRGLDKDEVRSFVGQRVQIDGRLDPKDLTERGRTQSKEGAVSTNDLPELHATSIKAATGDCKAPVK